MHKALQLIFIHTVAPNPLSDDENTDWELEDKRILLQNAHWTPEMRAAVPKVKALFAWGFCAEERVEGFLTYDAKLLIIRYSESVTDKLKLKYCLYSYIGNFTFPCIAFDVPVTWRHAIFVQRRIAMPRKPRNTFSSTTRTTSKPPVSVCDHFLVRFM
jgi:hypothetical protein